MKLKKVAGKARNLLHNHPLLTKGGIHKKSEKTKRRMEKQKINKEWCPLVAF